MDRHAPLPARPHTCYGEGGLTAFIKLIKAGHNAKGKGSPCRSAQSPKNRLRGTGAAAADVARANALAADAVNVVEAFHDAAEAPVAIAAIIATARMDFDMMGVRSMGAEIAHCFFRRYFLPLSATMQRARNCVHR